ncbi:3-oxoacyl-[acyl-carrier-protein] synthase, partial [Haematococcus lacustris]
MRRVGRIGAARIQASALKQRDPSQRVVVTGIGLCSVFGNDPDEFYSKLLAGTSGVTTIDRFDAKDFPTRFGAQIRNFDDEKLIDAKNSRRYDDCLKYTVVSSKKALRMAGLEKEANAQGYGQLDLTRVGVLVGTGMGGLSVFQDGVTNLVTKGHRKISPFFIPYAITNMGGALLAIDQAELALRCMICAVLTPSTLVGDVAEVKAVRKVFTDFGHIKMNSTKSMIGHCLGAAGGLEAIAVIKAIETGWVHPTLNQDNLVEEVAGIDTVANEKKQHAITAGISNSFGFGGHNSVCVFAPFKG